MSEQRLIIGNSLEVLKSFEDESIDLCVTSPPYWNLRDYGSEPTQYGNWCGQLGLEESPIDYIEHLVMIFDEVKRVLKKTGSCWVNIGDSYSSNTGCYTSNFITSTKHVNGKPKTPKTNIVRNKSLVQIPSRFALAMCDQGWILRNECIWHKPNPMPISVKDRFTVDYEKFYFFTKEPNYYFKQILEPIKQESIARAKRAKHNNIEHHNIVRGTNTIEMAHNDPNWKRFGNPEGRNKRTVWTIPTHGSHEDHVAMFPLKLIETPINACCPENGVVLDPFCGSGTTLEYCRKHNIDCIGIEINPIYKAIIERKSMMDVGKLEDFA